MHRSKHPETTSKEIAQLEGGSAPPTAHWGKHCNKQIGYQAVIPVVPKKMGPMVIVQALGSFTNLCIASSSGSPLERSFDL